MKIRDFYHEILNKYKNTNYLTDVVLRSLIVKAEELGTMSQFFFAFEKELQHIDLLMEYIEKVIEGIPYQYVINEAEFYHNTFMVDSRVLIPRMETEELVDIILNDLSSSTKTLAIGDICTGSGCIAISIRKNKTDIKVYASDISSEALEVASFNASKHNCDITLIQGDLLKPFIERKIRLDVLISNPPYISNRNEVDEGVLNYEPHLALFASEGINFYIEIFKDCFKVLNSGALMYFEFNYDQKELLTEAIVKYLPNSKFEFYKDSFGKWRMLKIYYKE